MDPHTGAGWHGVLVEDPSHGVLLGVGQGGGDEGHLEVLVGDEAHPVRSVWGELVGPGVPPAALAHAGHGLPLAAVHSQSVNGIML